MTATVTDRTLVRVTTILDIKPIPDADSIDQATIDGWNVVVRRGEFQVGDKVLYFEIDSLLPLEDDRFAFLAPRGTKVIEGVAYHRLKTARLRSVYSQGLVLPYEQFSWEDPSKWETSSSWEEVRGVVKYEPPMPTNSGDIVGEFPTNLVRKTDSERVQNLVNVWDKVRNRANWVATEKVDGVSCTVLNDNGTIRVMQRNWELADGDNLYWNAVHRFGIDEILHYGEAVQMEIFGEGIQKNRLQVKQHQVIVFDFIRNGVILPIAEWPAWAQLLQVPTYVGLTLPETVEQAIAQVDGLKSLVSPHRAAEGVVWHTADGSVLPCLDYRSTFKVISNKYLLKNED